VDDSQTTEQALPKPTKGINWSALLGPAGLESPGYQETLAEIRRNPYVPPKKRKK